MKFARDHLHGTYNFNTHSVYWGGAEYYMWKRLLLTNDSET